MSTALRAFQPHDDPPPRRSAGPTVREIGEWHWSRHTQGSREALKEKRRIWSLFLAWEPDRSTGPMGELAAAEVIGDDLVAFVSSQPGVVKANTVARWYRTLKQPFHQAVQLGRLGHNPFRAVRNPRGDEGRDLTKDEFQTALRNANPGFRRVLVFLRFTGARPIELRRLRAEQITVQAVSTLFGIEHMGWAKQREHKTAHVTGKPRMIPLPPQVLKLIAWIRRHRPEDPFLFLNSFGKPWKLGAMTKYWRETVRKKANAAAARAADRLIAGGLSAAEKRRLAKHVPLPEDAKLYGCRHMFATQALLNNVHLAAIGEFMGHAPNSPTTNRYLHLADKKEHLAGWLLQALGRKSTGDPVA